MKLCVFQGTFNPIHNAHLRIANYIKDVYNFDKIIFIPAYCPPHKNFEPNNSLNRFKMVKLAIQNCNRFEISDIEYKRKGKSYTILTINELYKLYDVEGKINFIIGTDAFKNLKSWYKIDELKTKVKFIVFIREENFDITEYESFKNEGFDFEFQKLPFKDISSTLLRKQIKLGENIDKLVPEKVKEYIKENGIYKN